MYSHTGHTGHWHSIAHHNVERALGTLYCYELVLGLKRTNKFVAFIYLVFLRQNSQTRHDLLPDSFISLLYALHAGTL